jgi:hypothetical protein
VLRATDEIGVIVREHGLTIPAARE